MAHAHLSEAAYFAETTPGTPPADASAWVSSGTRIRHLQESLDVTGIVPVDLEDMRSQVNILDHELRVEGLRNGSHPISVYLTGTGTTTGAGSQVSSIALDALLGNALGGVDRSNSTTLSGTHSTTSIEVAADTNFAVGGHVAIQDANGDGKFYVRRLIENTSGTTWTLDEALPFTPADSDVVAGCTTIYVDPDVLADSNSSGRQFSWWLAKGGGSAENWELTGCKLQLDSINVPRGELPTLDFTNHYSNFTAPNESPPDPSWSANPSGVAPVATGPEVTSFIADYGTTTQNGVCVNNLEISPGVPILRDEVQTSNTSGMMGTCKYYLGRGETTATFMLPFDTTYMADWAAGTYKVFRYANAPVSAGQGWAFGMPRAEVMLKPHRDVNGEESKQMVTLKAHRDTATIGSTDLARSPFYIVLF
jgi:hypothetical protein